MGGLCSKVSVVDNSPSDKTLGENQVIDHEHGALEEENQLVSVEDAAAKRLEEQSQSFSFLESVVPGLAFQGGAIAGGETETRASPRLSRSLSQKAGLGKVSEVSSILGRASNVGIDKAVDILDTVGSSVTSLNASSGFMLSSAAKGNKMCMLAFEVANTIVRGCNLMRSVSKSGIKHLKEVVFRSEGVQELLSKDMDELLKLAAADKREELEVFTKEVVRFGNRCKDPQWHNLDRYFEKLALERIPQHDFKEDVQSMMQQLIICAQCTSELYHALLKQEVKGQVKHVESLKRRSFWSKNLDEMMEKLIDIVHFLHLEMYNAFGCADTEEPQEPAKRRNRLGPAGLALHYANIINLIDFLASQPSAVPNNKKDTLFRGLPPTIKSTLCFKIHSSEIKELTATQIKAEMEKTLQWLVPFANNTMKAHHGFGWVGEWANKVSERDYKLSGQMDFTRIETLYHAEKATTEAHIFELVVCLHHLVCKSTNVRKGVTLPIKSSIRSPTQNGTTITLLPGDMNNSSPVLTQEDQDMLMDVKYRKFIPGISKSQEFDIRPIHSEQSRLRKSKSYSPASGSRKDLLSVRIRRHSVLPVIDFEVDRTEALDQIDRLDDLKYSEQ